MSTILPNAASQARNDAALGNAAPSNGFHLSSVSLRCTRNDAYMSSAMPVQFRTPHGRYPVAVLSTPATGLRTARNTERIGGMSVS